ncbi:adenylate/guanylate cyclase domain-containing protein [Patiriisocius hiemis]|uniref:Adenylate/guanylate cyclase domain-containing protein n=1 Tax=Patiriisocius hiemis TaxID=3075604 RepID=A0ABU2YEI2_9FLAO|nr:adenylate/guanylate cyclase domain-containing protein [Constantimarinum sp. W242]MDT0556598.1 adenylate/guanylate cyclase domain-containing protein [Constantimarinum sp. W242]
MKEPRFKKYTSRQLWYYTKRALYILFAWVLISNLIFFYEFFTLKSEGVLSSSFDFKTSFTANLIVGVIAGLIGGIFTVNLMERWLRKYAFWKALLYIIVIYIVAAYSISALGAFYYYTDYLSLPFYHEDILSEVYLFFGSWLFIKNLFIWLVIVVVTLIVLIVNDKYGPGVFPDYLMGRYFMPKNERRIFMFADIRDATTIAEKLGEEKYFNFLKDFYRDIAPAIVQTRGEVYQYVGDEVVISWKMKHGLKNGNAIRCFYSMKKIIAYKSNRYLRKYNVVPEFKVGFHFGNVMVGEIGKLKRDIAFSGDVLNTTSRIQEMCNELQVDILASSEFGDIAYKLPKGVAKKSLGAKKLKGKANDIGLVTYYKV